MTTLAPPPPLAPPVLPVAEYLTAAEIAARLGLSKPHVYRLIEARTWGPPLRAGRAVRVRRDRLDAWLAAQAGPPPAA